MERAHHVSDAHRRQLAESGWTEETIALSGVRTVVDPDELSALLGWRWPARHQVPALVFPVIRPHTSEIVFHRVRPDDPRRPSGGHKGVKYEQPRKIGPEPIFPRPCWNQLRDATVTLVITEGEKKGWYLAQLGYAVAILPGVNTGHDVEGNRGPRRQRKKMLHRLFDEHVRLNGRPVAIVFDSDSAIKKGVHDAERRLSAMLSERGAEVRLIRVPPGKEGKRLGIDDFGVAHGDQEVRRLLDRHPGLKPPSRRRLMFGALAPVDKPSKPKGRGRRQYKPDPPSDMLPDLLGEPMVLFGAYRFLQVPQRALADARIDFRRKTLLAYRSLHPSRLQRQIAADLGVSRSSVHRGQKALATVGYLELPDNDQPHAHPRIARRHRNLRVGKKNRMVRAPTFLVGHVTDGALWTYAVLLNKAGRSAWAWISYRQIAEQLSCSYEHVRDLVEELDREGLVRRYREGGRGYTFTLLAHRWMTSDTFRSGHFLEECVLKAASRSGDTRSGSGDAPAGSDNTPAGSDDAPVGSDDAPVGANDTSCPGSKRMLHTSGSESRGSRSKLSFRGEKRVPGEQVGTHGGSAPKPPGGGREPGTAAKARLIDRLQTIWRSCLRPLPPPWTRRERDVAGWLLEQEAWTSAEATVRALVPEWEWIVELVPPARGWGPNIGVLGARPDLVQRLRDREVVRAANKALRADPGWRPGSVGEREAIRAAKKRTDQWLGDRERRRTARQYDQLTVALSAGKDGWEGAFG